MTRPGYLIETRKSSYTVRGYTATYVYGTDSYERHFAYAAPDGTVTSNRMERFVYRPLSTSIPGTDARVPCDLHADRTPAGLTLTAALPGAYRALDLVGRTIWTSTASVGETFVIQPSVRGAYAIQRPLGCATVMVW